MHCDHKDHILTLIHARPPGVLRSRVISPLSRRTKPRFLVLCWLEWKVAAMCCFSPSNSRLNDVCFLKCPSAHCCWTELSFICSLLNKFCYSLLWILSQGTTATSLQAASDVQHSRLTLAYSFHSLGFAYYPVKKKHSGLIFSHLHFLLTYFKYNRAA